MSEKNEMALSSRAVFQWPEFKAFAKRLGIDDKPTRRLTIELEFNSRVVIKHDYLGTDATNENAEPPA